MVLAVPATVRDRSRAELARPGVRRRPRFWTRSTIRCRLRPWRRRRRTGGHARGPTGAFAVSGALAREPGDRLWRGKRHADGLEDPVEPELRQAREPGPGGGREGPVREEVADPLGGAGRVALLEAGAVLADPAAVVPLVHAHRRREHERQPERAVEAELRRLRPEHVRPCEERVHPLEVPVEGRVEEELDALAERVRELRLGERLLHLGPDVGADAGDEREPEPPGEDRRAERGQELARDPGLRPGAADRVREERRAPLLGDGERPEHVLEDLALLAPEGAGRVEPDDPAREVREERAESRAADELVREREAGEGDAGGGDPV